MEENMMSIAMIGTGGRRLQLLASENLSWDLLSIISQNKFCKLRKQYVATEEFSAKKPLKNP